VSTILYNTKVPWAKKQKATVTTPQQEKNYITTEINSSLFERNLIAFHKTKLLTSHQVIYHTSTKLTDESPFDWWRQNDYRLSVKKEAREVPNPKVMFCPCFTYHNKS